MFFFAGPRVGGKCSYCIHHIQVQENEKHDERISSESGFVRFVAHFILHSCQGKTVIGILH